MAKRKPSPTKPIKGAQYKRVKISTLLANPVNSRIHDERDLPTLCASLEAFGQCEPLVIQKSTGMVIGGNGRLEAMKSLGWEECDIAEVDVSDKVAHALGIALNATAEKSSWNAANVEKALAEIDLDSPELKEMFDDLAKQLEIGIEEPGTADAEPQLDRAAELQKKWQTKTGDLWLIGEHRLLCGDSTKREDVERVMGDERAGLMNTDPPYGVAYANDDRPNPGVAKPRVAKPRVANDDMTDERLQEFLEAVFKSAVDVALKEDAAWYMWHAHLTQGYFAAAAAAAAANVVLHRQIIWVKPVLLLGRGHYHWKHEPCFMGWVKGHQPPDYGEGAGERTQTTIWEIGSVTHAERKEFNHSTPKPTGLFTIPIIKHLKVGEIAYEPFAGSGPQFVAAQNLNRRCCGIEISPAYCAVILERMATAFPALEVKRAT